MNNVGEKFLPIGTVVMLQGGTKRVMITGFCSMPAEDGAEMYDYAGCMYPEGFLSSDQTALFNHSQIAQVYHMGLVDDEEKQFKRSLNMLVAQMKGGNTPTPQAVAVPPAPQPVVQPVAPVPQPVEVPVPPIGPGLPGYVAPAAPAPSAPTQTGGYTFGPDGTVLAAPQPAAQSAPSAPTVPTSIKFDENGVVVSA